MTEEKVKSWDRVAEAPQREHVATAAEREHWSNTYYLKQTPAVGAGTIATTKHPFFAEKRKIGIENKFVDKETMLSRSHKLPTGSGKIGAVGKVGII